jgi:hypothetical protein
MKRACLPNPKKYEDLSCEFPRYSRAGYPTLEIDYLRMKIHILQALTVLILYGLTISDLQASRYITVATIGNVPSPDLKQTPDKLVAEVINFWQKELAQVLPDKPDLIVLPEFCDLSGAGDEYLMVRKNQILDFFATVARSNKCYLTFGMKREETKGIWRNSCILLDREGKVAGIYDKNYPTIREMEMGIVASDRAHVFQCDFGRVAIAICFDLNFDELRMKYAAQKPDIIIFSSMYHGGPVQSFWAYSCRSFFVGSVYRSTPSEIRNPLGEIVAGNTNYFDFAVARINLDYEIVHLDYNWERLSMLKKKYGESVEIHDPGRLGSVLITSLNDTVTAKQMADEFNIERLDDYFERARNFRQKEGNLK